jgi:hypothetical protein
VVRLELEGRKVEVWLTPGMDAAAFERRVREALELESDEELDMMFEVPRPQGGEWVPAGLGLHHMPCHRACCCCALLLCLHQL